MKIKSEEITSVIKREIQEYGNVLEVEEVGTVLEVGDGIARIYGLSSCMAGEMIEFENGSMGLAFNLDEDSIGVVILGNFLEIKEGDQVKRTGRVMSVPCGEAMIGRVVDPLGSPLDGLGPIDATTTRPLESRAPGIADRQP